VRNFLIGKQKVFLFPTCRENDWEGKEPGRNALRALLEASLHGFPSLCLRENFKKVKKSIPQQLPFPFPFPGK
jgi:hypothetical protein